MSRAARSEDRTLDGRFNLVFAATGEVVEDVEALVRGVLGAEGWPAYLEPADEAELVATLLGDAVILERRYAARDGIEARPWLFERLRLKARDWRRFFYGRAGQHRTLPAELGPEGSDYDDGDADVATPRRDGSHGAPGEIAGDRGDPGLDALRGLLESGDRALLREVEALGLGPPPGARGRSPSACEALDRLDRARLGRLSDLDAQVAA